jgi:hypothetical protein
MLDLRDVVLDLGEVRRDFSILGARTRIREREDPLRQLFLAGNQSAFGSLQAIEPKLELKLV